MPPYLIHAVLMAGGFILLASGVFIVMRLRNQRWWFKTHRMLGLLGAVFMIAGWIAAAIMLAGGGDNPAGLHAYLGVATILLSVVTAGLGLLQFRLKKKQIRIIHHWTGRATVIMQAANIALGLRLIGIL
ncbi:MAG: cytochrome b561 domain-containing protein [Syntrophaceae bacterium]